MEYTSKANWHLAHLRLMLCGVLLGSSVGHVLHALVQANLPMAQALSSCGGIALANWAARQNRYCGKNWF